MGIALILLIFAGAASSYAFYRVGFKQATTEAQVDLAKKDAEIAAAKSDAGSNTKKSKGNEPPAEVKVTTLGAADLNVEGLASLPSDAQAKVLEALNSARGACEPCFTNGLSVAACLKSQYTAICTSMPSLASRAVTLGRQGKSVDDIKKAITYDDAWVSLDVAGLPVSAASAPITIIEVSDFQCPYCSRAHETANKVKEKYGDKVRFAFVNYPLSFHQFAETAALAAVAADKQGKFWPYHNQLFTRQGDLSKPDTYASIAQGLGLNVSRFEEDRASAAAKDVLKRDLAIAGKVGVKGTPTFIVNGYRLRGAKPLEAFERVIDLELSDR